MKLKPIYNNSTNSIIYDYIVYMEQNDLPEFINIESLDLPHFIGKIQHQQKEIEKLSNELDREKSKVKEYGSRLLKAIEHIEQRDKWFKNEEYKLIKEKDLLNILKGEDNK